VLPNSGGRNKFEPINSRLLPPNILVWVEASRKVGATFNPNIDARQGVGRGYILPEPAMIAGLSNENTRQSFIRVYLKLCNLLLYWIQKAGVLASCLSPDQWRSLLGLELFQTSKGTHAQQKCMKLREDLEAMYKQKTGIVHGEFGGHL
jgi:hypothetical protein